jgi:YHS domain-containing protein
MSKLTLTFLITMIVSIGVVDAVKLLAADPAPATQPTTQPLADAKPINTKCIVSGEDVDPKVTEVYNGVTYGFCCQDCVKAFNKNPQKYLPAAK